MQNSPFEFQSNGSKPSSFRILAYLLFGFLCMKFVLLTDILIPYFTFIFQFGVSVSRILVTSNEFIELALLCTAGALIEYCVCFLWCYSFFFLLLVVVVVVCSKLFRSLVFANKSKRLIASMRNFAHLRGTRYHANLSWHSCYYCNLPRSRTALPCSMYCHWMPTHISK